MRALPFTRYQEQPTQWMLQITKYADRLLGDLDKLEWPEKVKKMQTDWIGKILWCRSRFPGRGKDEKITVYTTSPDTLHGATFHGTGSGA